MLLIRARSLILACLLIFVVSCGGDVNKGLVEAVELGDAAAVRDLIADGADANLGVKGKRSILMTAATKGHTEAVKELLTAGADPKAADAVSPTSQLRIANLSPARMFARFRRSLGRTICPRSSILTTADTLQQVQPADPALDVVCASLSIIYPQSDYSDYSEESVIYKTVDESVNYQRRLRCGHTFSRNREAKPTIIPRWLGV